MGRCYLLVAVVLIAACTEAETEQPPPLLFDLGDPCQSALTFCFDDNSVQLCKDAVWIVEDCAVICAELGPAYVADACVGRDCECALADPRGCVPGQTVCAGENEVSTCSDSQTWETSSCDESCGQIGLLSRGCDEAEPPASCRCTAEGTACDPETPAACVDVSTLASCEAGTWVFEDCGSGCEGAGATGQCVAWAAPSYCECS